MDKATVYSHVYRVSMVEPTERPLRSLIDIIKRDELEDRIRAVGNGEVRLDQIKKERTSDGVSLWYLDFTRFRDTHGPGRTTRRSPVTDIPLEDDDFFGEETAALFLPDTGHIIIQYNHFGVRPNAMLNYFSKYLAEEANVYAFNVLLDRDAERRFRRQRVIRRFEVGIDLSRMSAADRRAGNRLSDMAEIAADDWEGARMKILVSVGQERDRGLANVKQMLENFVLGNDAVVSAHVTGRETPGSEIESVDLIEEKLVYPAEIIPTSKRRLAQQDRFKMLRRAFALWRPRLES